jgi:hypothetical protein
VVHCMACIIAPAVLPLPCKSSPCSSVGWCWLKSFDSPLVLAALQHMNLVPAGANCMQAVASYLLLLGVAASWLVLAKTGPSCRVSSAVLAHECLCARGLTSEQTSYSSCAYAGVLFCCVHFLAKADPRTDRRR